MLHVLVSPCALRVRGVLAALTTSSVDLAVKSGQCKSTGNSNNSSSSSSNCNHRNYGNVSNKNTINDTSIPSTGNRRLWFHPQQPLVTVPV
jgi:hypothetical protein